jgi:SecD/SecF fusion protein
MTDFLTHNGYWFWPLLAGAVILLIARLRARPFFWRIAVCVVPLVLAARVVAEAWYNDTLPPIQVQLLEETNKGDLPHSLLVSSTAQIVVPDNVTDAAYEWYKRQKLGDRPPESFYAIDERSLTNSESGRYHQVRLNFALPPGRRYDAAAELARFLTAELNRGFRFNLGVDLAGGTILVYEADPDWWNSLRPEERARFDDNELAEILKRRIDPNNLMEVTIRPVKRTAENQPPRVEIILPMRPATAGVQGSADIERIKNIVGRAGKLEFRILADTRYDNAAVQEARDLIRAQGFKADEKNVPPAPDGYQWVELSEEASRELVEQRRNLPENTVDVAPSTLVYYHAPVERPGGDRYVRRFILTKAPTAETIVTGEDLQSASPFNDPTHGYVVSFSLKAGSQQRFAELTKLGAVSDESQKPYMAIILDNRVMSYPRLQNQLRDNGIIIMSEQGTARKQKVDELVQILRSGALPATLKQQPVSELTMGPTLGQETIEKGEFAVVISLLAVVAFMTLYYRFAGLVASAAVFANLLLTVGFMVAVKAAFTLPGLAGLVLTLGMAVDANVLIFERMREERERGASLALALRNGYDRAFPAIFDSNLTTIFTAVVLFVVGNDQLKGFGITLATGLVFSMFTALYMTRLVFDMVYAYGWLRELRMMKLMSRPNIDFMRVRYYWFTATVLLSIFGLVVFVLRGEQGLNIDFTGGTAYSIEFKEPKRAEEVRQAVANPDLPPELRLRDPSVDAIFRADALTQDTTTTFTIRTPEMDRTKVRQAVAGIFGDQLVWVELTGEVKDAEPTADDKRDGRAAKRIELTFANKAVAREEVDRLVTNWLQANPQFQPGDVRYEIVGVGPGDQNLYKQIAVQIALPEDLAGQAESLKEYLVASLHQPKSDRLENFDSQLAEATRYRAMAAIALSWLAVCLYLWFRFGNWTFGLAAVLCLIHDLIFALGLIGFSHYFINIPGMQSVLLLEDFKLDLAAVAALLTLIGYSVNDTIVVFDRIREVRGKSPELTPKMINDSLNQTLSRTVLTGITTFLGVIILYVLGGEGIHLFSFVMLIGLIIGTYSSIFVASPLLLMFGEGRQPTPARAPKPPQPQETRV